jgi:pimeloyl-ACP methyl ester carboxylesterase
MIVDLVRATTADGVRLDGALHAAADAGPRPWEIDAFLLIHGTGASFYGSSLLEFLAMRFQQAGAAALLANTRGHDIVSTASTSAGPRRLGAAYERVSDGLSDIAAWIDLLTAVGHRRIGLVGHSLGAIKGVLAQAERPHPAVACLIAISPARLSHAWFDASRQADLFRQTLAVAQEHIAAGRGETLMHVEFPLPYIVTAAGYVDKYGPGEQYNVLGHVDRLACPTLFTFGSAEVAGNVAFAGLPEEIEAQVRPGQLITVTTIAGADHVYSGARAELAARIERWLGNQASPRSTDATHQS